MLNIDAEVRLNIQAVSDVPFQQKYRRHGVLRDTA